MTSAPFTELPQELRNKVDLFLSTVIELEKEDYHNDLVPFAQHAAEIREKGAALFLERQRKLERGKALLQELFEEKNNPSDLSFAVFTTAVAAYKEKMKEVLELPQAFMHRGFQVAKKLLEEEKYEDAEALFLFLHFLQPNVFEYLFGQAVCQQALEHYEEAISSYRLSLQQEPTNPVPFFLMAGCLHKLEEKESCGVALDCCIELAEQAEEVDTLFLQEARQLRQVI